MLRNVRLMLLVLSLVGVGRVSSAGAQVEAGTEAEAQVQAPPPPPPPGPPVAPFAESADKPAPNSVFFEGLGAGLWYSINYERRVIDDLGVRAGLSYLSVSASSSNGGTTTSASATYLTIPLTVSYLGVRGRRSGLEVGGGMTLAYASGSASSGVSSASDSGITPFGTALIGYRLHPVDGAGFQFRVGLMALAAKGLSLSDPNPDSFGVLPWFYISFGAGF